MYANLFFLALILVLSLGQGGKPPSPPSALPAGGRSGIKGTTRSVVVSGVPGGATIGGPASIEFAIAPVDGGVPAYASAKFVRSDARGTFEVELPPGTYWIGPREKALDPTRYVPGAVVLSELMVVVKVGTFVSVEVVQTGYAP
jgi:hypothetical protein